MFGVLYVGAGALLPVMPASGPRVSSGWPLRLGMGARALRDRARVFVQAKQGSAQIEAALVGEREKVETLTAEVAELRALVQQLAPKKRAKADDA